mmetsp:Transcript_10573/g.25050  ORF Transcript_10573/g.25050 Transcript_10573/m.25050 type:complete len:269 (+) Transcript_10573:141-947(+)
MRETFAESLRKQRMAAAKAAVTSTALAKDRPPQSSDSRSARGTANLEQDSGSPRRQSPVSDSPRRPSENSPRRLSPLSDLKGLQLQIDTQGNKVATQTGPLPPPTVGHTDWQIPRSNEDDETCCSNAARSEALEEPGTLKADEDISEPDPAVKEFLSAMQHRLNPAAVAERMKQSKEREREAYEALLTYEMIVENPIAENDPAIDKMLASRTQLSTGGGRGLGMGAMQKQLNGKLGRSAAGVKSVGGKTQGLSSGRREQHLPRLPEMC